MIQHSVGPDAPLFPDMHVVCGVGELIAAQTCWRDERAIMQAWSNFIVGP